MSIFNSLGSNYSPSFVLKALTASNHSKNKTELIELLERKYKGKAILFYKGREALEEALKIINPAKDSFVAINGFTCFVLYQAVVKAGLKVEYLDIEAKTLHFSAGILAKKIKANPQIKVVVVQNTLGYPCDIEKIEKLCKVNEIILIEDLAHSVGTVYENGKEAGQLGDFVILSFSQDKVIDGISGGALIIRNSKYQKNLKPQLQEVQKKQQKIDRRYPLFTYLIRKTYSLGFGKLIHFFFRKFKMLSLPVEGEFYGGHDLPAWYCSLINKSFENNFNDLEHRAKTATFYKNNLSKKILSKKIAKQISHSTNIRFPIFIDNRAELDKRENLIKYLKRYNIYISDIWYDAPIAPKRYLSQTTYKNECPEAEKISLKIVNLPTHKNISEKDALYICQKVNQWLKSQ